MKLQHAYLMSLHIIKQLLLLWIQEQKTDIFHTLKISKLKSMLNFLMKLSQIRKTPFHSQHNIKNPN
jgi:hypothetical protein